MVVDRFSGSTIAYQGYGRGLPTEEVREACDLAAGGRWPDLSVLLEVPLPVARQRRAIEHAGSAGSEPDRIEAEQLEFHERVVKGFHDLAEADAEHWAVIDGSRPPDEVAADVLGAVTGRLFLEVSR